MAGIPTEASIFGMIEKAMPGRLQNVYCAPPGGGKFMAVLQFKKAVESDEGRQRQAALIAFAAFSELKHIFLVDEDVDCFDMNDVMWAMTTRFSGRCGYHHDSGRTLPSARSVQRSAVQPDYQKSRHCLQDDL